VIHIDFAAAERVLESVAPGGGKFDLAYKEVESIFARPASRRKGEES